MIRIHVRDINGARDIWTFGNRNHFIEVYNERPDKFDDELYEIQLVFYMDSCIYSGLMNTPITFEELAGFFA